MSEGPQSTASVSQEITTPAAASTSVEEAIFASGGVSGSFEDSGEIEEEGEDDDYPELEPQKLAVAQLRQALAARRQQAEEILAEAYVSERQQRTRERLIKEEAELLRQLQACEGLMRTGKRRLKAAEKAQQKQAAALAALSTSAVEYSGSSPPSEVVSEVPSEIASEVETGEESGRLGASSGSISMDLPTGDRRASSRSLRSSIADEVYSSFDASPRRGTTSSEIASEVASEVGESSGRFEASTASLVEEIEGGSGASGVASDETRSVASDVEMSAGASRRGSTDVEESIWPSSSGGALGASAPPVRSFGLLRCKEVQRWIASVGVLRCKGVCKNV